MEPVKISWHKLVLSEFEVGNATAAAVEGGGEKLMPLSRKRFPWEEPKSSGGSGANKPKACAFWQP
eukprot:1338235-Pyramimonas_sp.AAC.1